MISFIFSDQQNESNEDTLDSFDVQPSTNVLVEPESEPNDKFVLESTEIEDSFQLELVQQKVEPMELDGVLDEV